MNIKAAPFIVGVWGNSGSGKTRLVEQLIPPLRARGVRVGTVKHASHEVTVDVTGKDSDRHAMAGAERVLLLGPGSATLFVPRNTTDTLLPWLEVFSGHVDVLLVEGFKRTTISHVQIEAVDGGDFNLAPVDRSQEHTVWHLRRPAMEPGPLSFPSGMVDELADEIVRYANQEKPLTRPGASEVERLITCRHPTRELVTKSVR